MEGLKKYRLEAGLTQEQLAEKAGVSRITISNIESGKQSYIKSSTLLKLVNALKVNPQVLLSPVE